MKVVWSEAALVDLRAVRDYIGEGAPVTADRFLERLIAAVDVLETFPQIGRLVPEVGLPDIREIVHQKYRLIYRLEENRVVILSVILGSRDLDRLGPMPWDRTE